MVFIYAVILNTFLRTIIANCFHLLLYMSHESALLQMLKLIFIIGFLMAGMGSKQ